MILFEPLNSIGIRIADGPVVGWQITHRIRFDTIRYSALFVRNNLARYRLMRPLLKESIRRQLSGSQFFANHGFFIVPNTTTAMSGFTQRVFSQYADDTI